MVTQFLETVDSIVWGVPLIVLMGTGLLLTIRLKVMQFSKLGKALKYMVKNEPGAEGEVTSFGALYGSFGNYGGTGNIVCGNRCYCRRSGSAVLDVCRGLYRYGNQVCGRYVGCNLQS